MSLSLWQQCLARLQDELPATEFSMWIRCHFRFGSSVLPDCRMSYQPQNSVCGYARCRRN
ncbi:DnaA N-terminal domain-containing protein [Salmonella enterica]|uniref:DnaA N-terminal domain-containing protein n=1 Tax=Salmonella enterica TaxID=28901 RepID=UPI003B589C2D